MKCKKCHSENLVMRPNAKNPSATELICGDCGAWQKFASKEEIRLFEIRSSVQPKQPINADRVRGMSDEELAEVSVYSTTRPDFDEGFDGEWYECGNIETWHSVFTADLYDSPDDAISYVLEWLQQKEEV